MEKRWETALQELKQAEEDGQRLAMPPPKAMAIDPELRAAFADAARGIPELWKQGLLSPPHKKALLRCRIDKVVIRRSAPETIQTRIIWRGGDTTSFDVPVTVASVARLSSASAMEALAEELFRQGQSDAEIADTLTRRGYRSPRELTVIPHTVRTIRLKNGQHRPRPGSKPRRRPGKLTVPQLVRVLDVPLHWVYQRIRRGAIQIARDAERNMYLFPDTPGNLAHL